MTLCLNGGKLVGKRRKTDDCVAFSFVDTETGIVHEFRRKEVESLLKKELPNKTSESKLTFLNVNSSSTETLNLTELGFKNFMRQYETILELQQRTLNVLRFFSSLLEQWF